MSFDFNVSYSSCWGYSLINTLELKKLKRAWIHNTIQILSLVNLKRTVPQFISLKNQKSWHKDTTKKRLWQVGKDNVSRSNTAPCRRRPGLLPGSNILANSTFVVALILPLRRNVGEFPSAGVKKRSWYEDWIRAALQVPNCWDSCCPVCQWSSTREHPKEYAVIRQ